MIKKLRLIFLVTMLFGYVAEKSQKFMKFQFGVNSKKIPKAEKSTFSTEKLVIFLQKLRTKYQKLNIFVEVGFEHGRS